VKQGATALASLYRAIEHPHATHSRSVLDQWCNRAFHLEHGSSFTMGAFMTRFGNMISATRVKEDEKGICYGNGSLTIEPCRNQGRRKPPFRNDNSG
jgi:hypothetical protein